MKRPIKICKNPDCQDEILEYKSSKREYCSDSCRNQHGHKRRTEENADTIAYNKGYTANYKLIKFHKDCNILIEELSKLEKMGFNTNYLPAPKLYTIGNVKVYCYKIKDVIFGLNPENTNQIIIYKQTEKK